MKVSRFWWSVSSITVTLVFLPGCWQLAITSCRHISKKWCMFCREKQLWKITLKVLQRRECHTDSLREGRQIHIHILYAKCTWKSTTLSLHLCITSNAGVQAKFHSFLTLPPDGRDRKNPSTCWEIYHSQNYTYCIEMNDVFYLFHVWIYWIYSNRLIYSLVIYLLMLSQLYRLQSIRFY